ncbi:hypothetical protein BGZ83_006926 [Gryganskiella cystojenkinii]|nr:hypothetical protein BGZ83_006926 [Gryganskiella cystojenkinii]
MDRLISVIPALHSVSIGQSTMLEQSWVDHQPTPPRSVIEGLRDRTGLDLQVLYYWFQCRLYLSYIESVVDLADFNGATPQFPDLADFHELMLFSVLEFPYCQQLLSERSIVQKPQTHLTTLTLPTNSISDAWRSSSSPLLDCEVKNTKDSSDITQTQIDSLYPPLIPCLLTHSIGRLDDKVDKYDDEDLQFFQPPFHQTSARDTNPKPNTLDQTNPVHIFETPSMNQQWQDLIASLATDWRTSSAKDVTETRNSRQRANKYRIQGGKPTPMSNDNVHAIKTEEKERSSNSGKVFVGRILATTTKKTLTKYFSQYGQVSETILVTDGRLGPSKGYAFVTFADPKVADRVRNTKHQIEGRWVHIGFTLSFEDRRRMSRILVEGIPHDVSEEELLKFFSDYGRVIEASLKHDDKTGYRLSTAVVSFDCYGPAASVIAECDNLVLRGQKLKARYHKVKA